MNIQLHRESWVGQLPFLPMSLAFAVGVLAGASIEVAPLVIVITVLAVFITIVATGIRGSRFAAARIHLIIGLFFLSGWARMDQWSDRHLNTPLAGHLPLYADSVHVVIQTSEKRQRVSAVVNVKRLHFNSAKVEASALVKISFPNDWHGDLLPGQHVLLKKVDLLSLPDQRNPGQFDYGSYLRWRGVQAVSYLRDSNQISLRSLQPGWKMPLRYFAAWREKLAGKFTSHFSTAGAGFMKALLLGKREGLDRETLADFQNAGVMHVLAISGLHVGFVAVIGYLLLSFLPIYFKKRNLLLVAMLLTYMFLTGAQPPVVRATLMASLFLVSQNLERPVQVFNILCAAMFVILVFAPQQLFWVGFQFSFVAVAGILYLYPKLEPTANRITCHIANAKIQRFVHHFVLIPFLVSLAAQLATAPLTMFYFHKLSIIALIINVLVIPYIGLLVLGGFLFLAFSFLHEGFALATAGFLEMLITLLNRFIDWSASLPGAYLDILKVSATGVVFYFLILFLIFNLNMPRLRRWLFGGVTALAAVSLIGISLEPRPLNLLILDVGQGDAALVSTPQGKSILIDAGPSESDGHSAAGAIIPALQQLGHRRLDKVFLTHPHNDHIGGFFALAGRVQIDSVFLPPVNPRYFWQDSLMKCLNRFEIGYRFLSAGDRVMIDGQTRVYVFGPVADGEALRNTGPDENINNRSLVLQLRHFDKAMLFTGDAEVREERGVQKWGELIRSQFLKVAHHGSTSSTSEDFLNVITPKIAAISVGKFNRFGHPSPRILERLKAYQVEIHRTDREGAIWLQILQNRWHWYDWRRGKRQLLPYNHPEQNHAGSY